MWQFQVQREANLFAANEAFCEIVWLKRLLEGLTVWKSVPILKIDSETTTLLAENPESQRRTKHIQTQYYFFIRELVAGKQIMVNHEPAEFQLADCMTKLLYKPRLMTLWQAMELI